VQNQQGLSGLSFEQALAKYRDMSNADKATLVDKRRSISPLMAMAFLAAEPSAVYAQAWQQRAAALNLKADNFASEAFQRFAEQVLLKEVQRIGSVATAVADSANALFNPRRAATREAIWAEVSRMATAAGLNRGFDFQGDTDLSRSKVHLTGASGVGQSSIDMFTPGGKVQVGSATATAADMAQAATRGLAAYGGGDVRSYSKGDFLVASQKVHIVGSGDIMVYSAEGDIDSGRGSNNAVTVPPKVVVVDAYGTPRWTAGKTTVGSGMAIFVDSQGRREGKISLLAPRGEVRALDAFIDAPSIELAGPVLGADNLQGSVAGSTPPPPAPVPVAVNTGLGAETAAGEAEKTLSTQKEQAKAPSSLLTVDVLGLGDAALPATAAGQPARKEEDKAPQDSRN
jgi:filamentous hemagglutinin